MFRVEKQEFDLTQELKVLEKNITNVEISFYGFRSREHSNEFSPYQQATLLRKSNNLLDLQINKLTEIIGNYKKQIQDFIIQQKLNNPNYQTPKQFTNQMVNLSTFQDGLDKLKPILKQRFVNDAAKNNDNETSSSVSASTHRR